MQLPGRDVAIRARHWLGQVEGGGIGEDRGRFHLVDAHSGCGEVLAEAGSGGNPQSEQATQSWPASVAPAKAESVQRETQREPDVPAGSLGVGVAGWVEGPELEAPLA